MAHEEKKFKVCVIGAGAAGLCAVRHLAENAKFETAIYEQTNEIGGTWVYKEQTGFDENGLPIHSSMYQNLRHYFDPYIPNIPGIESFPGLILHSHAYRKPNEFVGKKVLVLGAASSGIDIAIELSDYAASVYLSHNHDRLLSPLPSNMIQVAGVQSIHETTFHLRDGITVNDINILIFCTGYKYNFPFLDENCGIRIDNNYVTPLYKHLISIEHPSICIVGIPMVVVPFPMFHMQVQYFLALLEGRVTLPTKSVMLENSFLKTPKKRHAHKLMDRQWDYNDSLAIAGGFNRLPLFYKLGYNTCCNNICISSKICESFAL